MIATSSLHTAARDQATRWARGLLKRQDFCILDCETTGLGNTAEIIQVAAIDALGSVLIDALVKPTVVIESGAYRVHGISQQIVGNAKPFDLVFLDLLKAVGGRELVVYNDAFDLRLIRQSLAAHDIYLHLPEKTWVNGRRVFCCMKAYSQWVGDWDDRRGSYRWQKLPGASHDAVGDCKATLEVIRRMTGVATQQRKS